MSTLKRGYLNCATYKNNYTFYIGEGFLQDSFLHLAVNPNPSLLFAEMLTECKWTPYKSYVEMLVTIKELPSNKNILNDFNKMTTDCYLRHTVGDQESVYLLKNNELFCTEDLQKPIKLNELMFLDGKWTIVKS
jgi:hypothetical protein